MNLFIVAETSAQKPAVGSLVSESNSEGVYTRISQVGTMPRRSKTTAARSIKGSSVSLTRMRSISLSLSIVPEAKLPKK